MDLESRHAIKLLEAQVRIYRTFRAFAWQLNKAPEFAQTAQHTFEWFSFDTSPDSQYNGRFSATVNVIKGGSLSIAWMLTIFWGPREWSIDGTISTLEIKTNRNTITGKLEQSATSFSEFARELESVTDWLFTT